MTPGGYGVDTAELKNAGAHVQTQAVDQLRSPLATVESVDVLGQDFGREHTHHFQQYQAGIDRLVAMVKGYLGVCDDFGRRLGGASSAYQSMESETDQAMRNQRGALGGE